MTLEFQDEQGELYRVDVAKSDREPFFEVVGVLKWVDGCGCWQELPNECAPEDWLEYARECEFHREKAERDPLYYVEMLALERRMKR